YHHSALITLFFLFLIIPPPPISTLFPYTTLFRSRLTAFALGRDRLCRKNPAAARERECADAAEHRGHSARRLPAAMAPKRGPYQDRKSTRLNSSHSQISYAVFCLKKKKKKKHTKA